MMQRALAISVLLLMSSLLHAAQWHRAYVIEWYEPAFYYGAKEGDSAPGTDCPAGTNPDMDWRKVLKTSYRDEAEIDKILDPEKPLRGVMGGIRGPDKENVYEKPWSVPDPGMIGVTGKVAYGFNLDGKDKTGFAGAKNNFGGERGIDNEYYRAAGCWTSWRGPPRGSHHAKYVNDGMRDGALTSLMVISGTGDDWRNDPDVRVAFYLSKDKMVKDANGDIARDYSYRVNSDPRFQSIVTARTVNGVIASVGNNEIRMRDIETAPFFPAQLLLQKAQLHLESKDNGEMFGLIGGYRPIDDYYTGWAAAGAIHELTTHINMPAYWYALRRHADGMPDDTGRNTAISTAYHLYMVPAFVTAPDGDKVVSAAQLFEGAPPAASPSRMVIGGGSGGGASKVYPPPPGWTARTAKTK